MKRIKESNAIFSLILLEFDNGLQCTTIKNKDYNKYLNKDCYIQILG